jgi:GTPase SAR1 family protein
MFGRQMEMEHVMNFLLQEEGTPGVTEDPAVLPIIGSGKVGKSTLIEHACNDERVRNHFSQILCFSGDDIKDASIETLRDEKVESTIKVVARAVEGHSSSLSYLWIWTGMYGKGCIQLQEVTSRVAVRS